MIISTARDHSDSSIDKYLRHCLCIVDNLSSILSKIWTKSFSEGDCLGEDRVFMRTSLNPWKYRTSKVGRIFFSGHNHRSTWSTKRLMSGSRDDITVGNWIFENSTSNESCNVGNICHENRPNFICNRAKSLPINTTAIC